MIVVDAGFPDALDCFRNDATCMQHRVDVDLGLGCEPGDCRAADVVDIVDAVAKQRQNSAAFGSEFGRPGRIVVDNFDRSHAARLPDIPGDGNLR